MYDLPAGFALPAFCVSGPKLFGEFIVKILSALLQRLKGNKEDNDWWKNLKCIACKEVLMQKPYSYCGHCKRTLCKKCGYIPGGCGWCGG